MNGLILAATIALSMFTLRQTYFLCSSISFDIRDFIRERRWARERAEEMKTALESPASTTIVVPL